MNLLDRIQQLKDDDRVELRYKDAHGWQVSSYPARELKEILNPMPRRSLLAELAKTPPVDGCVIKELEPPRAPTISTTRTQVDLMRGAGYRLDGRQIAIPEPDFATPPDFNC